MTSTGSGFFGRLSWDAFPIAGLIQNPNTNEIVANAAAGVVVVGVIAVVGLLTWFRLWGALWRDWLTSADHKKIGIMYVVFAIVMLARGVLEGVVMRAQQAAGPGDGFLEAEHFAELFSTHGTIMIFFVAVPFVFGVANFLIPLMIGARDVAFPVMNQISLGLTVSAGMMLMVSLVVGEFSTGGWTAYPPYTGAAFNPGVGPDYWIWAIVVSGIGTTLTGINFAVTIYKLRAPGMKFMRLPMYCWTIICSSILIVFAMPPLGVAALMLAADRYLDFHFFTNDLGGNMMNYANLFWLFGHPEVYLLGPTRLWDLFRGVCHIFSQAPLRVQLTGDRNDVDCGDVIHSLAASFLHYGAKRTDQCGVWYCHYADCYPDWGQRSMTGWRPCSGAVSGFPSPCFTGCPF